MQGGIAITDHGRRSAQAMHPYRHHCIEECVVEARIFYRGCAECTPESGWTAGLALRGTQKKMPAAFSRSLSSGGASGRGTFAGMSTVAGRPGRPSGASSRQCGAAARTGGPPLSPLHCLLTPILLPQDPAPVSLRSLPFPPMMWPPHIGIRGYSGSRTCQRGVVVITSA